MISSLFIDQIYSSSQVMKVLLTAGCGHAISLCYAWLTAALPLQEVVVLCQLFDYSLHLLLQFLHPEKTTQSHSHQCKYSSSNSSYVTLLPPEGNTFYFTAFICMYYMQINAVKSILTGVKLMCGCIKVHGSRPE